MLPFGLTAAPATFQRLMERVLHGLHWKSLLLYLDDVIVVGKTFTEHYDHLEEVLTPFRGAGLKLKPSKCHLFKTEVNYLGHVVSHDGVATDPGKISAVANWPVPRNLTELRAFLGTVGYYRQYVESFASKARPLTRLTAKDVKFQWCSECQNAFDLLKNSLTTAPVLGYPDPALEYILDTDASLDGVGSVLSQIQAGHERVISYYSRALSSSERNYCVTRRELLAVVKAVTHFRPYLYGKTFTIRTDHASLLWLCRRTTPSAQVARWLEILSEFNFTIEYRAGLKHGNADGLSRRPCQDCKQCGRVLRICGGPSMEEVEKELSDRAVVNNPVSMEIVGEQLCTSDGQEGVSSNGNYHFSRECGSCRDNDDHDVWNDLPIENTLGCNVDQVSDPTAESDSLTTVDSKDCSMNTDTNVLYTRQGNAEQICPVDTASPCLSNTQPNQSESVHGLPQSCLDGGYNSDVLSQAQQQMGDVAIIYGAVKNQTQLEQSVVSLGGTELRKLHSMFSLMRIREDEVLVRRVVVKGKSQEAIIAPKKMRREIMWNTHTLAHAGVIRTLRRLCLTWYWPGITSDTRRLIKTCEICQKAKYGGLRQSSSQGPLWVGRRWQKVAIDLVGPFPVMTRGNKWILVLTDHFTRWQDALPLPDATAPVVAEVLDSRVFCYFGLPEELHIYRGSQFEGDLITELCYWWRITKTRTTPYHPQSNGVVERGNRTLGDALRCMLLSSADNHDNWDCLLPHIMRAFRATPHSKTDETANFLMMGRECRLPDQLVNGSHTIQLTTRADYAVELKNRLESVYDLLRSRQTPLRSADFEEETLFKPGDLVLVERKRKRKGVNPKLEPKFDGPFLIKKAFMNGSYKVSGRGTVNECRLKLFTPCPDLQGQPDERPPNSGDVRADSGRQNVLSGLPTFSNADPWGPVQFDQTSNLSFEDDPREEPPVLPPSKAGRVRRVPARFYDFVRY